MTCIADVEPSTHEYSKTEKLNRRVDVVHPLALPGSHHQNGEGLGQENKHSPNDSGMIHNEANIIHEEDRKRADRDFSLCVVCEVDTDDSSSYVQRDDKGEHVGAYEPREDVD